MPELIDYEPGIGDAAETPGAIKPEFHCADLPETSRSGEVSGRVSFGVVGVMEFGLKGTSRVCRGRHGEVSVVEFELNGGGYNHAGLLGAAKAELVRQLDTLS